jgi:hypothetical protein
MTWDAPLKPYRVFMITVTMAVGLALAGPNQGAGLSVDMDFRTAPVESLGTAAYGSAFWIGVRIADARYLDTFGFRLGFDSSLVGFVKAVPESPQDGVTDFLASRGGTAVGFLGRISSQDSTQVAIGNGLAGRDSAQAPGGSGLLVMLEFIAKGSSPGKAVFSISEVKLLDWQQSLDTLASVQSGAVLLGPAAGIAANDRSRRVQTSRLEGIAMALHRSPAKAGFYLLGRRE